MLCKLSYWALELHGSVAPWPPETKLQGSFETELHGFMGTWPSLSSYALQNELLGS